MLGHVLRLVGVLTVVVGLSCGNVGAPLKGVQKKHTETAELVRHVYLGPEFTTEQIAMISEAAKRWETATRGGLHFEVHANEPLPEKLEEEGYIYIIRATSKDRIAQIVEALRGPGGGGIILGWTFPHRLVSTVILFVDRIDDNKTFTRLVVHEFGHTLGIGHLDSRHEAVMYPFMDGATMCPTRLDLEALCDIYGCDPEIMAPCSP